MHTLLYNLSQIHSYIIHGSCCKQIPSLYIKIARIPQYLCECSILTCYVEFFFGSPYMSKIRKNAYVGRTNTHVYKYSFNTQGGQKISRRVVNSNTMQQQSLERRLQKNICVEIRIRFVKRSYKCVVSRKICNVNWILPPWILGENYSKMGCLHPYEALTTRMAPYRFRNERTQWLHERRLQWISECVYSFHLDILHTCESKRRTHSNFLISFHNTVYFPIGKERKWYYYFNFTKVPYMIHRRIFFLIFLIRDLSNIRSSLVSEFDSQLLNTCGSKQKQ